MDKPGDSTLIDDRIQNLLLLASTIAKEMKRHKLESESYVALTSYRSNYILKAAMLALEHKGISSALDVLEGEGHYFIAGKFGEAYISGKDHLYRYVYGLETMTESKSSSETENLASRTINNYINQAKCFEQAITNDLIESEYKPELIELYLTATEHAVRVAGKFFNDGKVKEVENKLGLVYAAFRIG